MSTTIESVRTKIAAESGSVTDSFSVTAGRTLAFIVWGFQRIPQSGDVSDDLNGSWGAPTYSQSATGNSDKLAAFVKTNSAGGSMTLTMANCSFYVGTTFIINTVASPTIQVSTGAEGSGTSATSGSVTPANATACAIGFMTHNSGNPTLSADTGGGWTLGQKQEDYNGAYQPGANQYKDLASADALTSTITMSSSVAWLAGLLVISDAGGGGGGTANPWYAYAQQRQRVDLWWKRRNWIWVPAHA